MREGLGQGLDEIHPRGLGGAGACGFDCIEGEAVGLRDAVNFIAFFGFGLWVEHVDLVAALLAALWKGQVGQSVKPPLAGGVAPQHLSAEIKAPHRVGAAVALGNMGQPGEHLQAQFMALRRVGKPGIAEPDTQGVAFFRAGLKNQTGGGIVARGDFGRFLDHRRDVGDCGEARRMPAAEGGPVEIL